MNSEDWPALQWIGRLRAISFLAIGAQESFIKQGIESKPQRTSVVPGPETSPWLRAARLGLADPVLARAARQCFDAAEASLSRSNAPPPVRAAVAAFAELYVRRGRCPADDILDSHGELEGQS